RALAGDPEPAPVVLLELGVVVMAVHLVGVGQLTTQRSLEGPVGRSEQLPTVLTRVRLRPREVADVRVELVTPLLKPRQLRVLQLGPESLVESLGDARVQVRELVPAAAGTRVQQDPDDAVLIRGELDEVVARAQRAELLRRTPRLLQRRRRRM